MLKNDFLEEEAHFNFPKIYMMSHFAMQIHQYDQLPQYSIEIGEGLHKPQKDTYRRTNHIEATLQILKIYTRNHAFAMKELNLQALSKDVDIGETSDIISEPTNICEDNTKSFIHLQYPQKPMYSNLQQLGIDYQIPDVSNLLIQHFKKFYPHLYSYNSSNPNADFGDLLEGVVESFSSVRICRPASYGDEYIDHIIRSTSSKRFRTHKLQAD